MTTIKLLLPFIGTIVTMYSGDRGYPYDCKAKDKHPDSIIYYDNPDLTGAWAASHDLVYDEVISAYRYKYNR